MNSFLLACQCLWQGFKDLFLPGVRPYVIIPLLINILIFGVLFYYGFNYIWHKLDFLSFSIKISWLQWLNHFLWVIKFFVMSLVFLSYLAVLVVLSTFLAVMLAAPFNSLLSEALANKLGEKPPSVSLLKVVWQSLWRELIKFKYYFPKMLLAFCLAAIFYFIPVVNILSSVILFIASSWMLAIEYLDYPYDNVHTSFGSMLKSMREKRTLCLSYGAVVCLLSAIPVLNFIIMPIAVLGATRLYHAQLATRKHPS